MFYMVDIDMNTKLRCQTEREVFIYINKLSLQFSTKLSSSGGIIFLKGRVFLDISAWFLFYRIWRSCFFIKLAVQRGVNYLKIRGARGVLFMENTPWNMDNIGKNAGCLLFMLFSFRFSPRYSWNPMKTLWEQSKIKDFTKFLTEQAQMKGLH